MSADISPEDEAEIQALAAGRSGGIPTKEFFHRLRAISERGLMDRYREVRGGPKSRWTFQTAEREWFSTPEYEEVRRRLVVLAGSEEYGSFLARTNVSQGVGWIFEERAEPLDLDWVVTMIWRKRNLFGDLGDTLAWGQLKEQLESDG